MTNSSPIENSDSTLKKKGYAKILDALTESIWIGDEQDKTVYINPNFCHLTGYTLEEMTGKGLDFFWHETHENKDAITTKKESSKYEWMLRAKNGELIPALLSRTPLLNGGTAGVMTDLREIKAVKDEFIRLQELNQLKDEFISLVGHELRTPMTGIRGYLTMIRDGDVWPVSEQASHFLDIVIDESKRLIDMINDMLDIAKLEAGKMEFKDEPIFPVEISKQVIEGLSFLAKQRELTLVHEYTQGLENAQIYGDAAKLRQVLINLLANALKFTNPGGTITLRLSSKKGYLLFEVVDTGIGIPKEHLLNIFEKFKQVNNYLQKSVSGTGLGLYICKKILSHFRSDLFVESTEGVGSTFYFSIPLHE